MTSELLRVRHTCIQPPSPTGWRQDFIHTGLRQPWTLHRPTKQDVRFLWRDATKTDRVLDRGSFFRRDFSVPARLYNYVRIYAMRRCESSDKILQETWALNKAPCLCAKFVSRTRTRRFEKRLMTFLGYYINTCVFSEFGLKLRVIMEYVNLRYNKWSNNGIFIPNDLQDTLHAQIKVFKSFRPKGPRDSEEFSHVADGSGRTTVHAWGWMDGFGPGEHHRITGRHTAVSYVDMWKMQFLFKFW